MSRDDPQMKLRLPLDLKQKVEAAAKLNNRSLNSEILSRLEESFSLSINIEAPIDFMESEGTRLALEKFAQAVALKTLKAAGVAISSPKSAEAEEP